MIFAKTILTFRYLLKMHQNTKRCRKMEMIFHYASFYWIYVLWKEWFDRLINLSFLPKLFCLSSPPHMLKHYLSLILVTANFTNLSGWHLGTAAFVLSVLSKRCKETMPWNLSCVFQESKWFWIGLSYAPVECWILSHRERNVAT